MEGARAGEKETEIGTSNEGEKEKIPLASGPYDFSVLFFLLLF